MSELGSFTLRVTGQNISLGFVILHISGFVVITIALMERVHTLFLYDAATHAHAHTHSPDGNTITNYSAWLYGTHFFVVKC